MTLIEVDICHRMESNANVVLRDIDLNFQSQSFQVFILTNGGNYKHDYCHQIGRQVFAIEWRYVHQDFDLHYQGHEFECEFLENGES